MIKIMSVNISFDTPNSCCDDHSFLNFGNNSATIFLKKTEDFYTTLRLIQIAGRKICCYGICNVALIGEHWNLDRSWFFWQGFRDSKQKKTIKWPILSELDIKELENRVRIIDWVRDITNAPANKLNPEQLSKQSIDLLYSVGLQNISYRMIKGDDLEKYNYSGIYTVGRSSSRSPVFICLDYNPSKDINTKTSACLVGKGITFDSGGYNLKPSSSMKSMKADMAGVAILVGAVALSISRGLKKRVKIFLCIADNVIGPNAPNVGDIIYYRNGKSVEITNTDAEGRLILADGLIDACLENPKIIIDAATLTGAANIALGNDYHAIFSFDDKLVTDLIISSNSEFELFWRLPLSEFHRQQLQSSFADINNISSPLYTAGASTAAAFLSYFVKNYQKNWIHIDCSAAYCNSQNSLWSEGATGIGVKTIANLLNKLK